MLMGFFSFAFRRYLRETLKMANAEDLNRLTSCSLVLLGHIFLSLGNSRESMNMVTPAMQLASKIPDVHVQLWASAILKGNFKKIHRAQHFVKKILELFQRKSHKLLNNFTNNYNSRKMCTKIFSVQKLQKKIRNHQNMQ